jgi:2-polyprenyl-6-methoxyphenol hydroxylase-like FAD-dependent oxidoreductase
VSPSRTSAEVLVVGAGPTGLVLALWLTRLGVRVRVIDKNAEAGTTSRALAVQARTLEFYRQIGIADKLVERGRKAVAVNFRGAGPKEARAEFGDAGRDVSPFPFALIFPQDEHERLLIETLAAAGVGVERKTELLGFTDANNQLTARLRLPSGAEESCEVSFIAGCDGAHSTVRETLGIGFPGGSYADLFYVADVKASGPAMDGEIHIGLSESDFLALFPLKQEGHARLVGTIRDKAGDHAGWNDVSRREIEKLRIDVSQVNWFLTYRVHHRVADHFRQGSAFLLGDAAHIHSPVGGQGMNTGIGDAVNLAWKLAAVLRNRANAALLDSYEPERIAFARRLVATTDRAFTAITSGAALTRYLRLNLMTSLIPRMFSFAAARRFMFRTVSQTAVNYRGSSLSAGRAGTVHGGDRLPWVNGNMRGSEDNFLPLASVAWQVHVYGDASSEFRATCTAQKLPVHVFPWCAETGRAGFVRNAVYLIRPDGYVALANSGNNPAAVADYLRTHGITSGEAATRK